jgi:hypothetical protein
MPIFNFLAFSNSDLGRPGGSVSSGTFTVSGTPSVMSVVDNDGVFDDEVANSVETRDFSQQTLAAEFDGVFASGLVVQSVYLYTVTNNTTGEVGTAHLIRIYNGTNPLSPGGQSGQYYNSFSIPVKPGDNITMVAKSYGGQTPYDNLVICFTPDTMIATPRGPRPVQSLRAGDMIDTRDNGPQPLAWIGKRRVAAHGHLAPIQIAPGILGNTAQLRVSPNHRMLITAASNDLHFGATEVFVAAKHLLGHSGVSQKPGGMVTYIHLLFDRHEVVFANDSPSESLFPGTAALSSMDSQARAEVLALFPELSHHAPAFGQTARLCLTRQESRILHRLGAI